MKNLNLNDIVHKYRNRLHGSSRNFKIDGVQKVQSLKMNMKTSKDLARIKIDDRYGDNKQISNLSELDAQ